jgi:hypothetical protein
MEVNELRIGNYYNQFGNNEKVSWATLKTLGEDMNEKLWCKPIPLTREWLVNFKFEELKKDCRTFFKKGKFKVELSNGGNVYYNRNIFISSVHQLQNLYFALTGEELTFKSE